MTTNNTLDSRPSSPRLSVEEWNDLCRIMNGYIYAQTLATACDLDLFTYLSKFPGARLGDIESKLNLSPYSTRVLMLACCVTRLVNKDESGRYFNSPLA